MASHLRSILLVLAGALALAGCESGTKKPVNPPGTPGLGESVDPYAKPPKK